jgi:stage II sporulation protein D
MFQLLATCLMLMTATPASPESMIRVGLFSLFEPQQLNIRVATGEAFSLRAGNLNEARISAGERLRIRKTGKQLTLSVLDAYGRLKQTTTTQEARILPVDASTLELNLPKQVTRVVRGGLLISARAPTSRNALQIILLTEREMAVASVVAAEMSGIESAESLKALAIVVRSFMVSHKERHAKEGFDFCDTTHCQLYRGEDDLYAQTASKLAENAVLATHREVLSFNLHVVEGYYTAVCGGLSANPEMVWGGATRSRYAYREVVCKWCADSRYTKWERKADASSVFSALARSVGFRLSHATEVQIEKYQESDLVRSVIIKDRGRRVVLSADGFRRAIGRRIGWNRVLSPTFTLEHHADSFIFRGRGFGSQVGLCIAGAAAQAAAGRSYQQILNFYYPQTEIKKSWKAESKP